LLLFCLSGPFFRSFRAAKRQGISETASETTLRPRSDKRKGRNDDLAVILFAGHCEGRRPEAIPALEEEIASQTKLRARSDSFCLSLRGAKPRSNPTDSPSLRAKRSNLRLLRRRKDELAMTCWGSLRGFLFCHCEERSDEAVSGPKRTRLPHPFLLSLKRDCFGDENTTSQ